MDYIYIMDMTAAMGAKDKFYTTYVPPGRQAGSTVWSFQQDPCHAPLSHLLGHSSSALHSPKSPSLPKCWAIEQEIQ
jgi:hypothetical protein